MSLSPPTIKTRIGSVCQVSKGNFFKSHWGWCHLSVGEMYIRIDPECRSDKFPKGYRRYPVSEVRSDIDSGAFLISYLLLIYLTQAARWAIPAAKIAAVSVRKID